MSDHASALLGLPLGLAENDRIYLRPIGLLSGLTAERAIALGRAWRLAGGCFAFSSFELAWRQNGEVERRVIGRSDFEWWQLALSRPWPSRLEARLHFLTAPRTAPGGGVLKRPLLMGTLSLTPDEAPGGGRFQGLDAALGQAKRLTGAGADILDIGARLPGPGAAEAEAGCVEPVLRALGETDLVPNRTLLSLDTRSAAVMRRGLARGAAMLNDTSALAGDPESLRVAGDSDAHVVLVHAQGEPVTADPKPRRRDIVLDTFDFLERRVSACIAAGIPHERLIVDPGIGLGKRGRDNLAILNALPLFHGLGCPVLLGVPRKGLTGDLDRTHAPGQRLPDSLTTALHALAQGVQILRVDDVAETRQALDVWERLTGFIG